jgi:hypothetical protein
MARYDEAYRYAGGQRMDRGRPAPDESFGRGFSPPPRESRTRDAAARDAYTPGGFGPEWQRQAGGSPYDGDFRPHGGLGGGSMTEGRDDRPRWGEESVSGPARYGLGPYYRRLQQRRRPDEELKKEVEEALFYDTWVDSESITVEVNDGVVTLRGELPDHEEVRYATDDAWDVEGVRGVRSELRIDTGRRKPLDWVGGKRNESKGGGNGKAAEKEVGNGRSEGNERGNG